MDGGRAADTGRLSAPANPRAPGPVGPSPTASAALNADPPAPTDAVTNGRVPADSAPADFVQPDPILTDRVQPDRIAAGPSAAGPSAAEPALVDAWPWARPFTVGGWAERNGFTPLWTGLAAVVAGWLVFQLVANVGVAVVVLADLLGQGASEPPTAEALLAAIGEHARAVLAWNSVGQAVGFGLFTYFVARLTTRQPVAFLRVNAPSAPGLALSALGWGALYPVVLVAGQLNRLVPLPEAFREADAAREQMIEGFLLGGDLGPVFLVLTVALVPAVFEELLFRGYLMRQVERRVPPALTFAVVGLIFGAYHLSASQLLPLSILGAYLCFVVWATGSLWSGVLVHLLNNGLAVVASVAVRGRPEIDPATVGEIGGPWYVSAALALAGLAAVSLVGRLLMARREALTGGRPDAAPAPSLPIPARPAVPS